MKLSLSHYHIRCRDKAVLADWYRKKLGFEILSDVEAMGEKEGPLFVSADGGKTGIAIFSKEKGRDEEFKLTCIPAFEASPESFLEFYKSLKIEIPDLVIYDHLISYSLYFADPVGTKLEVLCSKYAEMGEKLKEAGIPTKRMNPSHDPAYNQI